MAKYQVKKGYADIAVCTVAPDYRKGNGRFELDKCSQRDLKYLYEVIKHPAVELVNDEQEKPTAPTAE